MTPKPDHGRAWTFFAAGIIGVLGLSVLGTLATITFGSARQMGGFARMEQDRKAADIARFVARAAFVPASLGDRQTLERVANVYASDPDLLSIEIRDAEGGPLLRRQVRAAAEADSANASHQIVPPAELSRAHGGGRPVGSVTVSLSRSRIRAGVGHFVRSVVALSALLLAVALAVDLGLIVFMTRRLRTLLDEARRADELARSNAELEQFAYVASHDLQEPLRKIVSFSELLQRRHAEQFDAEAQELFGYVVSGGRQMRELVADLLSYARVQSAAVPLNPADAAAAATEALASLSQSVREAGAEVRLDKLPPVLGDATQLRQLFQNLVSNALKFRVEGRPPRVAISAQRDGRYWRFTVRDNGIGIAPQDQPKLFQMMRRLHSREKYPGTGIGLALCKKIVERHGGRIWLESAVGEGTAFHFTLPAGPGVQ